MKELISIVIFLLVVFGPQLLAGYLRVRQNAEKQRELEAILREVYETEATANQQASDTTQTRKELPPVAVEQERLVSKKLQETAPQYVTAEVHQENTTGYVQNIRELISTPEGVMSAFIASEVFRRPEENW